MWNLNVKCKSIKILGKKKPGENLWDLGLWQAFLLIPKAWSIKGKTDELNWNKMVICLHVIA